MKSNLHESKEAVLNDLQVALNRAGKAADESDEPRYQGVVRSLPKLNAYVEGLPPAHPLFRMYSAFSALGLSGPYWIDHFDNLFGELAYNEMAEWAPPGPEHVFDLYGFFSREDPESFIRRFVEQGQKKLATHGVEPEKPELVKK